MQATDNATQEAIAPGSLRAWAVAVRPRTLWIAAIPVVVATSLAWMQGAHVLGWVTALAFAGSILMQVISNLQNDVGYTERKLETGGRVGLPRATARGWLSPAEVRRAIAGCIALGLAIAVPLVAHAGPLVLAIGGVSVLGALAYMGGPRPIAYTPFGELVVFVFFGLVAVLGTHYLHAGAAGLLQWLAAAAVGLHAAAVLAVNNHRDHEHDARTGRRTFAAAAGPAASARLYAVLLWTPFLLAGAMALQSGPGLALPLALAPWAWRLHRDFGATRIAAGFTAILFRTVMLELAFGMLLSAGAVLQRLAAA